MDHSNGMTGPDLQAGGSTATIATGPERATVAATFQDELARAMLATADRERERIAGAVAEDAAGNTERARARGAAENGELRRMAEEDVAGIQAWLKTEIERIRREAARRTDERRASLDAYLRQHDSIIETEVASVDRAVGDYRATLERFFEELGRSASPMEIARAAGQIPGPPDLEAVRAAARAGAVGAFADAPGDDGAEGGHDASGTGSGEAPIGVMDPALAMAPPADGADPLEAQEDPTDAAAPTEDADVDQPGAATRLFRSLTAWTEIL